MPAPSPHPAPPNPAQPIPCAACQYNLAGLPDTSICPECSMPIADTLASLAKKPPRQPGHGVRTFGFAILIIGCCLACVSAIIGPFWAIGIGFFGGPFIKLWPLYIPPILVFTGAWLTTAKPAWEARVGRNKNRIIARWLACCVIVAVLLPVAILWYLDRHNDDDSPLLLLAGFNCALIYPLFTVLTTIHVRDWLRQRATQGWTLARTLPPLPERSNSTPTS